MSEFDNQDSILDAAIESYRLAPLPSGFINRVMNQVRQQPQTAISPRFRLQFLDVALPAFTALFTLLLASVGMWLTGRLEAAWLPEVQLNLPWTGHLPPWISISVVVVLGELMVAILVGVTLWLDRPFSLANQP